jgi:SAM-dependent methyltransferase
MIQAGARELSTRRLFEDAGLGEGMRVMDLGSGAGDVAMLAARIVGPTGSVVGIERNPDMLATAKGRAAEAGLANLTFVAGDLQEGVPVHGEFDAIVGRLVLQYIPDPVTVVRSAAARLKTGGLVAFQENDLATRHVALPPSTLLDRLGQWQTQGFAANGSDLLTGSKLYTIYVDAGLPPPQMRAQAQVFSPANPALKDTVLGTLRSMRQSLIDRGIATAEDMDIDWLERELTAEIEANRTVVVGVPTIDAWTYKA